MYEIVSDICEIVSGICEIKSGICEIESDVRAWVLAWEIAVRGAWSMGQQLYFLFYHFFKVSPYF